jgi:phage-related protein
MDNTTTYTTTVDVEVTGQEDLQQLGEKAEQNDSKFKSLRAQIRETTVALQKLADAGQEGTKEFEDLRTQLDDLNDAQERVAFQSGQIDDKLASLPGPVGQVGQAIQGFNESVNKFGKGLTAALGVVGLIVSAFLALKESLSRTEEGQKKLTQITESFTKILNGLFAIIEPIAMLLADLVIQFLSNDKVLKVLSKTFATFAAIVKGSFTIVKELATFVGNNLVNVFKTAAGIIGGFGKVLAGVFTFDLDKIKQGLADVGKTVTTGVGNFVNNVKDRYKGIKDGVGEAFVGAEAQFSKGTKRLTELEKKNLEEQKKKNKEAADAAKAAAEKALQDRLKYLDAIDKLDEARLDKERQNQLSSQQLREQALLSEAKTEEEKTEILLDGEEERIRIEQAFAERSYNMRKKDIEDKRALYPKASNEYKTYTAELTKLDSDYIKQTSEFTKQFSDNNQKRVDAQKKALDKQLSDIQTYNDLVAAINLAAIKDEILRAEVAREQKRNKDIEAIKATAEFAKLTAEEQASVLKQIEKSFQNDLAKIKEDARVKENEKLIKGYDEQLRLLELIGQNLIAGTKAYFENRALILDEAEAKELAKLDITEKEKTAIKEKYVKLRKQLDEDEIRSYAAVASQTLSALSGITSALASSYDEEAKTSKEAFEKRKKLQKATAIMSAASGIIQILAQPSTLPSPFDFIVKGINAAALGIATAVQIRNINATQFEGGGSTPSTSALSSASATPPTVKLPTIEEKAAPTIQGTQGGQNPTRQLAETLANRTDRMVTTMEANNERPIKTYVVSGDITSQQALDRRTSRAATFSGGTTLG